MADIVLEAMLEEAERDNNERDSRGYGGYVYEYGARRHLRSSGSRDSTKGRRSHLARGAVPLRRVIHDQTDSVGKPPRRTLPSHFSQPPSSSSSSQPSQQSQQSQQPSQLPKGGHGVGGGGVRVLYGVILELYDDYYEHKLLGDGALLLLVDAATAGEESLDAALVDRRQRSERRSARKAARARASEEGGTKTKEKKQLREEEEEEEEGPRSQVKTR